MAFSRLFAAVVAVSSFLIHSTLATYLTSSTNLAVYWGQGPNQQRLRHFCEHTTMDIIPIGFIHLFPDQGAGGYPGSNFGNQCDGQVFVVDGEDTQLLSGCHQIVEDIPICQRLGKTILLSLGGGTPDYKIETGRSAVEFADFLWGAFGPKTEEWGDNPRPFGDNVVDGFDFDIEHSGSFGYALMANRFRQRFQEDPSKRYYLSAAPQCRIPDEQLHEAISKVSFDFIFVQFYNSDGCSARDWVNNPNSNGFTFDEWVKVIKNSPNPDAKLFIGLPASVEAAWLPKFYLSPSEVKPLIGHFMKKYPDTFGGIMLWEATGSERNQVDGMSYADNMKEILYSYGPPRPTTTSTVITRTTLSTTTKPTTTTEPTTTTTEEPTTTTSEKPTTTEESTTTTTEKPTTTEESTTTTTEKPTTSEEPTTTSESTTTTSEEPTTTEESTTTTSEKPTTTEESTTTTTEKPTTTEESTTTTTEKPTTSEEPTTTSESTTTTSEEPTTTEELTTTTTEKPTTSEEPTTTTATTSATRITTTDSAITRTPPTSATTESVSRSTIKETASTRTPTESPTVSTRSTTEETPSTRSPTETPTLSFPAYPTGVSSSSWLSTGTSVHPTNGEPTYSVPTGIFTNSTTVVSTTPTVSVAPTLTQSPPPLETITTVIVTSYTSICSTGFTTVTTTYTTTYCPGTVSATPTGDSTEPTSPPEGWTTIVTVCPQCAPTPTTVTLTVPIDSTAPPADVTATLIPVPSGQDAVVPPSTYPTESPEVLVPPVVHAPSYSIGTLTRTVSLVSLPSEYPAVPPYSTGGYSHIPSGALAPPPEQPTYTSPPISTGAAATQFAVSKVLGTVLTLAVAVFFNL